VTPTNTDRGLRGGVTALIRAPRLRALFTYEYKPWHSCRQVATLLLRQWMKFCVKNVIHHG